MGNGLSLRRRMLKSVAPSLPANYQEIEYISAVDGAYIDSGIECTSDLIVEFIFRCYVETNNAICGAINVSNRPIYFRHHCTPYSSGGVLNFYWIQNNSNSESIVLYPSEVGRTHYVYINPVDGTYKIDNTEGVFPALPPNLTTECNYGICARIDNNGAVQYKNTRIYSFKFYRPNLIGDFVPCYRKSDDTIGMYDLVSNQFFTNAGSGYFVKGPDIT